MVGDYVINGQDKESLKNKSIMTKFRIIEEQLEGTENIVRYYVQKREWPLFIPYWESLIHTVGLLAGSTVGVIFVGVFVLVLLLIKSKIEPVFCGLLVTTVVFSVCELFQAIIHLISHVVCVVGLFVIFGV